MKLLVSLVSLVAIAGIVSAASVGSRRISVRLIDTRKVFQLTVDPSDKVETIQASIQANWNVPLEKQSLFLAPHYNSLESGQSLAECNVQDGDTIWVYEEGRDIQKHLFVRLIGGTSEMIKLPFDRSASVESIKAQIGAKWSIPAAEQTLYSGSFDNQLEMADGKLVADYQLNGELKPSVDSTIWVYKADKKERQMFVRRFGGPTLQVLGLPYDQSQTVGSVKAQIEAKWNIPAAEQSLLFGPNHIPMEDARTLADYNVPAELTIQSASTIWLFVKENKQRQVFIRMIGASKVMGLPFDENETIGSIKSKIQAQWAIPTGRQSLLFGPNHIPMDNERTLADYKVPAESSIQPSSTVWLFNGPQ